MQNQNQFDNNQMTPENGFGPNDKIQPKNKGFGDFLRNHFSNQKNFLPPELEGLLGDVLPMGGLNLGGMAFNGAKSGISSLLKKIF